MLSDDEYDALRAYVRELLAEVGGDDGLATDRIKDKYIAEPAATHFALTYLASLVASRSKPEAPRTQAPGFPTLTRIDKNDAICTFTLIKPVDKQPVAGFARYWQAESKHATTTMFVKYFRDTNQTKEARRNLSILAEYQILRNLRDENIANVFDAGWVRDEDGIEFPFVATQWLDGCTLTEWRLKHCPTPSPLQSAEIAWVVASALKRILLFQARVVEEALGNSKTARVFHLDIKPDNIMVQRDDNKRIKSADVSTIKVIDFGSAGLPEMATARGTYQYKAPQRFAKDSALPDPTWDVYSIGGVLYFLTTGREPLPADPKLPQNRWDEWHSRITCDNEDLTLVTRKCLASATEDRYPSVVELEEDLYRVVNGFPLMYAKRKYSLAKRLGMLIRRCQSRNDINDHSMLLGLTGIPIVVAANYMWISHVVQVSRGIAPEVAFAASVSVTNTIAFVACVVTVILARGRIISYRMLEPVAAFVMTGPVIMHLIMPSAILGSPTWDQLVTGGMFVALELALLNITLGTHHKFWKSCRIAGWIGLCVVLALRPIFDSSLRPIAMPIALGLLETLATIAFGINAFVAGPSREGRDRNMRYF